MKEVNFHVTIKSRGIRKLLEKLNILKPRVDFYSISKKASIDDNFVVVQGNYKNYVELSNISII